MNSAESKSTEFPAGPSSRSAIRTAFLTGSRPLGAVIASLALLGTASAQSFAVRDDWTRNFRIGMQIAFNVKADFTLDGAIASSAGDPGLPGVPGQNHFYDDGYVRVDNTGNAGGVTSYWGYTDASQFEADTGQLVFKNTRGFTTQNGLEASSGANFGFEMAYGGRLHDWRRVRLGWEFGYGLLPLNLDDSSQLPATFLRVVQSFDTGGITLPLAPYQGGASGLGPLIPDRATERPPEIVNGTLSGVRELDVTLHSFRLGPTVFWRFHRRWALNGGVGPASGLVNGGYDFTETFLFEDGTTAANSGRDHQTVVVFGGYASASVLFRVVANADLYFSAQFLSLGDIQYGGSGRRATLDLGRTVITSIGINWPF